MVASSRLIADLAPLLGRGAAYRDLADGVRGLVLDGRLVAGQRVPAERVLADQLGLSRTTVTAALTLLRAEGLLVSRRGSGTVVAGPAQRAERPDEPIARPVDIDLTLAVVGAPPELPPAAERAVGRLPGLLSGPGLFPLGLPDLRAGVARRLTARGLPTGSGQILITQGALHGWDLVLRALAGPGTRVAIEQPAYPSAIDAARAHRVRTVPIAVDAGGWTLPDLRRMPPLVAVSPDLQNPTGYLADEAARRALLRACAGSAVVVDETFAELRFGEPVLPTAALGRDVITLGSLSKLVWAGLRIGWVRAAPELIGRLAVSRTAQDIAAPVLEQLIAVELLDSLDAVAADRIRDLRLRRDHLLGLVRGAGWDAAEPAGGMMLWADLGVLSSTRLARAALDEGVRVTPGPRFSQTGTHDRYLRLPFSRPPAVLTDAMDRLARAATHPATEVASSGFSWTA